MGKLLYIFLLSQGHMSVCVTVAKMLLYKYPDHEIYFATDNEYAEKVKKLSPLFKPVIYEVEKPDPEEEKKFLSEFGKNFYLTGKERQRANFFPFEMMQQIYISNQKKGKWI